MLEKVITLENVSLVDFLGVENQNIKEIASAFPDSKIISRGNEIRIQGSGPQILRINEILGSLLHHYEKYGNVTHENVISTIADDHKDPPKLQKDEILVFGTKG
ncbi:MAG: phosphate starvation-inducible protein PhoH, partial [Bacteroidota bacterium]